MVKEDSRVQKQKDFEFIRILDALKTEVQALGQLVYNIGKEINSKEISNSGLQVVDSANNISKLIRKLAKK